jgi:hypothetical protein
MCSGHDEAEMRAHMGTCPECSRFDMVVRRSLLLVRSLPTIDVSPDFRVRLEARLLASSPADVLPRRMRVSYAAAAVAAGVAFVAAIAAGLMQRDLARDLRLAPVVATLPDLESSSVATPALVATVPTGMSVWPAIMVASQAPMHFVAAELASER